MLPQVLTTNIKLNPYARLRLSSCLCVRPSTRARVCVFPTNAKCVCPVRGGHVADTKSLFAKQCNGRENNSPAEIICFEEIMAGPVTAEELQLAEML